MKEEKKKRYVIGVKVFGYWFYWTNLKMNRLPLGETETRTPRGGGTSRTEYFSASTASAPAAARNCPTKRWNFTTFCPEASEAKTDLRMKWDCATNVTT